jgi:hypothetical protein
MLLLIAATAVPGCFTGKACNLIACRDQFRATVTGVDGSLPSGTHVVEVTADGVALSCTFQVPLAMLPSGGTVGPACASGLEVGIRPATTCTEAAMGSIKSLTCAPIAGRFFEDITVAGTPAQLQVRVSVDDAVLLERAETPGYVSNEPNGPGCEPTCQQASAEWTLSMP